MRTTRNVLPRNTNSHSNTPQTNIPRDYFLLVFILSVPFWLMGGKKLPLPMNLPASALMWVNPMIAACILLYRKNGQDSVKELLKKAIDYRKIRNPAWYIPVLFLVPSIYFASYIIMRFVGLPLPKAIEFPVVKAPVFFLLFFIPAAGEELGWSGYAIDPMQNRWGTLKASLLLGLIWQIWHIIPDLQAGNSASWIIWHGLYSVALRFFIVRIYHDSGKSVFAATLVHTTDNVSWALFPNYGSHFDPLVAAIVAWVVAVSIIIRWRPKTLVRTVRRRTLG